MSRFLTNNPSTSTLLGLGDRVNITAMAGKDGSKNIESWFLNLFLLLFLCHPRHSSSFRIGSPLRVSFTKFHGYNKENKYVEEAIFFFGKNKPLTNLSAAPKDDSETTVKKSRRPTALQANALVDKADDNYDWSIMNVFTSSSPPSDVEASQAQMGRESNSNSIVWNARLLLLLSSACYGSNYTCIKILNEHIPLEIGPALRFLVAAMVSIPFLVKNGDNEKGGNVGYDKLGACEDYEQHNHKTSLDASFSSILQSNGVLLAGLELGLWNTIGYLSQARGLESTPASTSAFICSLAVVIVPLLDFFSGKKILKREIMGAILAVMGVGFLEMDGLQADLNLASGGIAAKDLNPFLTSGVLWSLVQPLAFGMGYWRIEHYTRAYPTEGKRLASSQLFSIAAFSVMGAIFVDNANSLPDLTQLVEWLSVPQVLGAILWTGVVTTALTAFIETFALKTLSAAETTIIYSAEPLFGSAIAAMVLGESMGSGGAAGAAMILGGCLLSSIGFGDNDN